MNSNEVDLCGSKAQKHVVYALDMFQSGTHG